MAVIFILTNNTKHLSFGPRVPVVISSEPGNDGAMNYDYLDVGFACTASF
jgi:hypothetical protein